MYDRQKLEDIAFILPFAGFFLLLPPILALTGRDTFIFGMPALPLYLFSVWFLLIMATLLISRRLAEARNTSTVDEPWK